MDKNRIKDFSRYQPLQSLLKIYSNNLQCVLVVYTQNVYLMIHLYSRFNKEYIQ